MDRMKAPGYPYVSLVQDAQVATATSGNGNLVFGDDAGSIHLINRSYEITTFRAYEITLVLAQQVQHSTFLFTIGVRAAIIFYCHVSF